MNHKAIDRLCKLRTTRPELDVIIMPPSEDEYPYCNGCMQEIDTVWLGFIYSPSWDDNDETCDCFDETRFYIRNQCDEMIEKIEEKHVKLNERYENNEILEEQFHAEAERIFNNLPWKEVIIIAAMPCAIELVATCKDSLQVQSGEGDTEAVMES